jgi:hypothetical protein
MVTLWLDKAYPIHIKYIHKLISLSMEGKDVTQGFQGSGKHNCKKGEIIYMKSMAHGEEVVPHHRPDKL